MHSAKWRGYGRAGLLLHLLAGVILTEAIFCLAVTKCDTDAVVLCELCIVFCTIGGNCGCELAVSIELLRRLELIQADTIVSLTKRIAQLCSAILFTWFESCLEFRMGNMRHN